MMSIRKKQPARKDLRTFGIIWTFFFLLIALYPFVKSESIRLWPLAAAAAMVFLSFAAPKTLKWPYLLWMKFGEIMGNIISKVALTLVFYLLFTPTGIIFRIRGRDLLNKKIDLNKNTYWLDRKNQPGPLENQY